MAVAAIEPVELVAVSPLRRAIHTASLGFGTDLPYRCTELARERVSRHTCDQVTVTPRFATFRHAPAITLNLTPDV